MPNPVANFARHYLIADTPPLAAAEIRRSALGCVLGMALAGMLLTLLPAGHPWLIPAVGATTVIVFVLPHSPLAQPWSVFGSYLIAGLFGLLAGAWVSPAPLAGALALGATVWLTARLRCMHPPGGAIALMVALEGPMSLGHAGDVLLMVSGNALAILVAAMAINQPLLRRRYPLCRPDASPNPHATADRLPIERIGLSHADLEYAIQELGTFVDIQEQELNDLYNLAINRALERHVGVSCGDIMARDVVAVAFGTPLDEAWRLLRRHKIKALPVVDNFNRVQGIVTVADFLRQLDETTAAGLAASLQGLLRRTPGQNSEKAEVVGQIMTPSVYCATVATPVSELVQRLSDAGLHHIPILDEKKKLVGMVTQSDLIAALSRRIALTAPLPMPKYPDGWDQMVKVG